MRKRNANGRFARRKGGFAVAFSLVLSIVVLVALTAGITALTRIPASGARTAGPSAAAVSAASATWERAGLPMQGAVYANGNVVVTRGAAQAESAGTASDGPVSSNASGSPSSAAPQVDGSSSSAAAGGSSTGSSAADAVEAPSAGGSGSAGASVETAEPAAPEPAAPTKVELEKTIKSDAGKHYTVRVEYRSDAGIPEGAELSIAWVMLTPEGYDPKKPEFKDRPTEQEKFVTAAELADRMEELSKVMDVQEGDEVFYTAFLDVSLKADGKAVKLPEGAKVKVTLETDAIKADEAEHLRASFFTERDPGAEHADALKVQDRSDDPAKDKKYEKGAKVAFETDKLSELGLMGMITAEELAAARAEAEAALGAPAAEGERDDLEPLVQPDSEPLVVDEPEEEPVTEPVLAASLANRNAMAPSTAMTQYKLGQLAGTVSAQADSHTVQWLDYDGTILRTDSVETDETPTPPATAPTRGATDQYTYAFAGWYNSLDSKVYLNADEFPAVTDDVNYIAQYTATLREYTVTWANDEGQTLKTDAKVPYGTMPEYNGDTPTKTGYRFGLWSPDVEPVTGDVTYTAVFTRSPVEIVVRDHSTRKAVSGAHLTLTNSAGVVVWEGTTESTGLLWIEQKAEEYAGGQCAKFEPGSEYTLKQTNPDGTYITPKGSWTLKVADDGKTFSLTVNADAEDMSTWPAVGPYGARFYIENVGASTITYESNYPADSGQEQFKETASLPELSYNYEYKVTRDDPAVDGYTFVGWQVDGSSKYVHSGDALTLDTISRPAHTMIAQWRIPLNVAAYTYAQGDSANAQPVADSSQEYKVPVERSLTFSGLAGVADAYGQQNVAVQVLNMGSDYSFAYATLQQGTGAAVRISALQYDAAVHAWQYKAAESDDWSNIGHESQLNLYYTQDLVNVRWVQAQENGALAPLDATQFPGSTVAVSYEWASTDSLIAAADKPVVQGSCYYRYLGFGAADAALGDLKQSGLQSFSLKNSENGFLFSADGSGDGVPIEGDTIYVVYSETPPEDSMALSLQNYTGWSYTVNSLYVGGELAANDWLAQGNVVRVNVDDETSQVTLQVMNAKDTVDANGKADLVLLGAGAKAFIVDGGFSESADAGTVASVAVEGSSKVVRTTLTKVSASENGLANTKGATRGVLEEDPTTVVVAFDSDLSDLTVNKTWGTGAFPETHGYKVDFMLHEGDGTVSKQCVTDTANAGDLYRMEEDPWSITVPNLPTRLVYSVSEEAVWEGSANVIGDFQPSYGEGEGDDARTVQVLNELTSDVCQVGDAKFRTVKAAVDYIESNVAPNEQGVKVATIEMLRDYIMAESGSVEIPEGCDITLTSVDADNPSTITRGFASAADTFLVNGKLTIANVTLSGQLGKTDMAKDGNGGLVRVGANATFTAGARAQLAHGSAVNGSAVYAEIGAVVNLNGATVTDCRATTGGAIGVADATCRINVSGDTRVTNNKAGTNGYTSNIYLDQDSNAVIQVVGALGEDALVGVYVPNPDQAQTLYNAHGAPAQPFATVAPDARDAGELNLGAFSNDRLGSGSSKHGALSELLENTVVWGETFSFTVNVQWLDDKLNVDESKVPAGAAVTLRLDGGYVTTGGASKEITIQKDASGAWTGTFTGVAKYNGDGKPYEYTVAEPSLPADFKRIIFTGDYAVSDNKLAYSNAPGNDQVVLVSNYYRYTEFTVQKKAENLPEGQTISSTYQVYRIAKDGMTDQNGVRYGGVGSVSDLPLALRSTVEFATEGGNRWNVTAPDGAKVQFHKFYDIVFGEFTYDEVAGPTGVAWQAGDVVRVSDTSGACLVYGEDGKWRKLNSTVKTSYIEFSRQDGNGGVEGVGGSSADKSCTVTGVSNSESKSYTFEADSKQLSSDYYYYAVETTVAESGGQGRTISDSHQLVATYDPKYEYNQLTQTVTVTNTYRDYLSVDKRWADDATTLGECVFKVYKVKDASGATADYLKDETNFKTLVKADIASMVAAGKIELVTTFKLPEPNGSWVHVLDDLDASQNVYFAWEESAGGVPISTPDTSAANVKADAVYSYVYPINKVNQITVKNMSDVLCKVVDADGTENPFRTLNDAYTYGTTRDPSKGSNDEFTIYMLRDYSIPTSDVLTIAEGKNVTLATATTGPDYTYTPPATDTTKKRATITRQSGNAKSFFAVSGNASDVSKTSLMLENIELDGANRESNGLNGGFVYATNATVKLRESDANDAKATGVLMRDTRASNGGAIYAVSSDVDVRNAEFQNCVSTDTNGSLDRGGGAIWSSGATVTVKDSTFTGCTAKRSGGAIWTSCVSTTVRNAAFTACTAVQYGGAVAALYQSADGNGGEETTVTGCAFTECVSSNYGGGVYSRNATFTVGGPADADMCTFTRCSAAVRGGGFHHENKMGTTNVDHCRFASCSMTAVRGGASNADGGAGFCTEANVLTLKNSKFEDGFAYVRGGGAVHFNLAAKETNVSNCKFESCRTQNSGGGALAITGLTEVVEDCEFAECKTPSSAGGAIDVTHYSTDKDVTVRNCTFTSCEAGSGDGGGAICAGGDILRIIGCTFDTCRATNNGINGGAISMSPDDTCDELDVYGCTFIKCGAVQGAGGAIYSRGVVLRVGDHPESGAHTAFTNCYARDGGGAIRQEKYAEDTLAVIENCLFDTCRSSVETTSNNSGGAMFTRAATVEISGSQFKGCTTRGTGGAVYQEVPANYAPKDYAHASVSSSTFTDCASTNSSSGALHTNTYRLTLSDDTFVDCVAQGSYGAVGNSIAGGTDPDKSTVVIQRTTFMSCKAETGNSGAVFTNAYKLSVTGESNKVTFQNCSSNSEGGALRHDRSAVATSTTLSSCSFEDCESRNNAGGGLWTRATKVAMGATTFTNCTSSSTGGAVWHQLGSNDQIPASDMTIMGGWFRNCEASKSSSGGIYTNALTVSVNDYDSERTIFDAEDAAFQPGETAFANCTAGHGHGGALWHDRGAAGSRITLVKCDFENCIATRYDAGNDAYGGAVRTSAAVLDVRDSSFADCSSINRGGAVYHAVGDSVLSDSKAEFTNSLFAQCESTGSSAGAIHTNAKTLTITGNADETTFEDCIASYGHGGAVYHDRSMLGSKTTLSQCSFKDCEATRPDNNDDARGGALCTWAAGLSMANSSFESCVAKGAGGAVCQDGNDGASIWPTIALEATDCSFRDCTSRNAKGGAIWSDALKFSALGKDGKTTFLRCTSGSDGGAINQERGSEGSEANLSACEFKDCTAYSSSSADIWGGAVRANAQALEVDASSFDTCTANYGGAIYSYRAEVTIKGSDIRNCTATVHGGGLYQRGDGGRAVFLYDSTFSDNEAGTNGGGVSFTSNNELLLDNCTFTGNSAANQGGAVYFNANNTLTLRHGTSITGNTLGNTTVENAAGIYVWQNNNYGATDRANCQLVLGEEGVDEDTITVYDNTTSAGAQSNVKLMKINANKKVDGVTRNYNRATSVSLLSNLVKPGVGVTGTIGVVNPGPENTQFGVGNVGERTGMEYIVSDIDAQYGKLDPGDVTEKKRIIWYAPPVCKITDPIGDVLYYGEGTENTAAFSSLKDAIEILNVLEAGYLHTYDGVVPDQLQIQMLVPEYTLNDTLPALKREVTLTTARRGKGDYDYPMYATSPTATITRGPRAATGSLFTVGAGLTFSVRSLTIDGGNRETAPLVVETNGGLVYAQANAKVVLSENTVLRNSAVSEGNNGGAVYITGGTNPDAPALVMDADATISGCSAGNGGGVYVTGGVLFDMTDAPRIQDCSASEAGGAVYVSPYATLEMVDNPSPVISGNAVTQATGAGAGIYLPGNDSKLYLQLGTDALFADNYVLGTDDDARQNGFEAYPLLRQDIYLGEVDEPVTSIVLTGDLATDEGDIWVWADAAAHYKTEMQFAVVRTDDAGNPAFIPRDSSLALLRNARDDADTENDTDTHLYGLTEDGVNVIWSYNTGSAKVVLRKVAEASGGYDSLPGAVFTVYKGRSAQPYVVRHDDGTRETLANLRSGDAGVFWAGVLPYGTYYLEETTTPGGYDASRKWFRLDIDDDGVRMSATAESRAAL